MQLFRSNPRGQLGQGQAERGSTKVISTDFPYPIVYKS